MQPWDYCPENYPTQEPKSKLKELVCIT